MKPLFARVLLKRKRFDKSAGGIIIPGDAQKRLASLRCMVVALGPTCECDLKPGDEVLIGLHAGTWVNEDGSPVTDPEKAELFVCQEEDVILKYEPIKEQPSDRAESSRDYIERAVRAHRAA